MLKFKLPLKTDSCQISLSCSPYSPCHMILCQWFSVSWMLIAMIWPVLTTAQPFAIISAHVWKVHRASMAHGKCNWWVSCWQKKKCLSTSNHCAGQWPDITDHVSTTLDRPFAQLLPGLETGHPVTLGQSPAYDFSVSDEQKAVFLVSVSDCSECDSYAGDRSTVTGCPVSNWGAVE